ncbi:class I SAM-dependent methyltransferase [Vibrio maerlii]|uniref:class I SAM-dependent methyltransferase n=1 Tax=Vibrio maerlii TaxID=2231648 RepID=UPI000E3DEE95|nr:class I SAM-dependent methyltransferase [Vibrio maerlii]
MSEQYNNEISKHYSAYRPPLHGLILKQALGDGLLFPVGLDIGCGTGVSSKALLNHCDHIIGVEPSSSMLAQTQLHPRIDYLQGFGDAMNVKDRSVDLVTFAGSLSYALSDDLVTEVYRVCSSSAVVMAYDFEVLLEEHLDLLNVDIEPTESNYNHAINFSGYSQLKEIEVYKGQLELVVTPEQLAHVLFSSEKRFNAFKTQYGDKAFDDVVKRLNDFKSEHTITVDIYFSTYKVI